MISVKKDILLEGPTSILSLCVSIQLRQVLFHMYANLFLKAGAAYEVMVYVEIV